jgi:sulfur-oxidizing protein SoxX
MIRKRKVPRIEIVRIVAASIAGLTATLVTGTSQAQPPTRTLVPYRIIGDAIPAPLDGQHGDPTRGRAVAFDPERGNCTICHPIPGGKPRQQGDVGPPLQGVGGRLTEGQIRLRIVDGTRINPQTIMPPYHRIDGLERVGPAWRGKPILGAGEIEDLIAYLRSLK